MEQAVNDVGEELLAESEAVSSMIGGSDGRADNNFSVGKGENIGRGRVVKVNLVEATTLAGGDEDDADQSRETRSARRGEAREGTFNLAAEERQCQRVSPLTIGPVDGDGFFEHGDLEGSECVGEGYSRGRRLWPGGRCATRFR
jgi:hypothetical protein